MVPKNKRAATSDLIAMTPGLGVDQAYQRPFMDVRELVASLWCERFWVVTATLAVLALVALYLLVTPKTYTATAQLLIDLNRPLTGEAQSLGADTTRFMMGPIIDSQVEIIRATRIVSRVIQKTGYAESVEAHELPEDAQAAPETSPSAGNAAAATGDAAAAGGPGTASPNIPLGIIGKFQENLDVRRKGLTLILLVQFSDKDPVRAATVANAIVDEYLVDRDRREQAASKRAVETLRGRIAQARADLAANEQALQELSEKYNLVSAGGSTLDEREVAETATQLNLARAEEAKLLADLQQWEAQSKDTTGIATIGKLTDARHNYEVARNQVALLEKTLASMKRDFAQKTTALNRFAELQKET